MIGDRDGSFSARSGVSKGPFGRNILYYALMALFHHGTTLNCGELSSCSILSPRRLLIERYDHTHSLPSIISSVTSCNKGVAVMRGIRVRLTPVFPKQIKRHNYFWRCAVWICGDLKRECFCNKFTNRPNLGQAQMRDIRLFFLADSDSAPLADRDKVSILAITTV